MKTFLTILTTATLVFSNITRAEELPLTVVPKGVEIDAGSTGRFVLEPPDLNLESGSREKPVFEVVSETEGLAKYPSGATVKYQINGAEIACEFSSPGDAKSLMFQMLVPIKFSQGGKYAFGGGDPQEFPAELSNQFAGTAGGREEFTVVDALGDGFRIQAPANWQALQDNRKFGWQTFAYQFLYDLKANEGKSSFVITVAPAPAK